MSSLTDDEFWDADLAAEFNRLRRRMREAHAAGRGVNLSAREVRLLGLSVLAEWWSLPDEDLDKPLPYTPRH